MPGVGAAPSAVEALASRGLWEPVRRWGAAGRPLLGVCLGAQLLLDGSDEGDAPGLDLIAGRCRAFPSAADGGPRQVPHIGWNEVRTAGGSFDAYFVHGYWTDAGRRRGRRPHDRRRLHLPVPPPARSDDRHPVPSGEERPDRPRPAGGIRIGTARRRARPRRRHGADLRHRPARRRGGPPRAGRLRPPRARRRGRRIAGAPLRDGRLPRLHVIDLAGARAGRPTELD